MFSIENKMVDINTCTYLGFSIKNKIRKSGGCGCIVSENYFLPERIENTRYSSHQNYFLPERIENTRYSSHHENMVHHSTIRPASNKGYGCNNAKSPRPPHCNTIIDVVVLGCDPIPTGDGATALSNGVHILGKIRLAGGV